MLAGAARGGGTGSKGGGGPVRLSDVDTREFGGMYSFIAMINVLLNIIIILIEVFRVGIHNILIEYLFCGASIVSWNLKMLINN